MDEVVPILLGIAWAIGTPIVALVALVRTGRLKVEVAALRAQLAAGGLPAAVPVPIAPPPVELAPFEPGEVQAPVTEAVAEPPPVSVVAPPPVPVFEPAVAADATTPSPITPSAVPPISVAPLQAGWEQRLGARAFIWLGAITLALAAIFLVRYSIEEGYLSPDVRVILAALFGAGLVAGAEWMRSRDDRVAQALAAAGIAALYGSLFSAVALYDMVSKVAAGGAAAVLTSFAIALSLRYGIFVAALAFVGGFASPAIIGSDAPNTAVLFGYLLAISAGTLAVIRHRGWWQLGWGVLAGVVLWTVAWMFGVGPDGLPWVAAFLVAVGGLFVWAAWQRIRESDNPSRHVASQVWSAIAITGLALIALILQDEGRQTVGWIALAIHGASLYAFGRSTPRFQYAAALAPLLSLLALVFWSSVVGGWQPDWYDSRFALWSIVFGGLYAAGAFALIWNAGRPGFWAALSVAAALSHFLLCWYVLRTATPGTPWGLISIGLAAPFLVAAERLSHWRDRMTGGTEALGYLAAGVSFFIAAAIPMELDRQWITVAYAIELAAVAAIAAKLELVAMRRLCWPLLAVVVVRFALNPEILDYPLSATPFINWILWSYGISIAALVVGRRYLLAVSQDQLVMAVEAAIALLVFVLATLEVRSLFARGDMSAPTADFLERALYVLVWGALALAALWIARRTGQQTALWAWRLLGGLAGATAVVVQTLMANPVFEPADVGSLPIVNLLLVAYAAPAALAVLAGRWAAAADEKLAVVPAHGAAMILAFAYVSLEVRHFFDPGFERPGFAADGLELYVYSIAWLLFGVALLALGFLRGVPALRHAGMGLVCIVVAKVFLIDMSGLQGLLRVFSFLGLGAALVGLGYAYRRFVFVDSKPDQP